MATLKKDIEITDSDIDEIIFSLSDKELLALFKERYYGEIVFILPNNNAQADEVNEFLEAQKNKWG